MLEKQGNEEKVAQESVKVINETLMELSDISNTNSKDQNKKMRLSTMLFESLQKLGSSAQSKEQELFKAQQKLEDLNKKIQVTDQKLDRKQKRLSRLSTMMINSKPSTDESENTNFQVFAAKFSSGSSNLNSILKDSKTPENNNNTGTKLPTINVIEEAGEEDSTEEADFKVKEISEIEKMRRDFFFSIGLDIKEKLIKKGLFINIDLNDLYEEMGTDNPYSAWFLFFVHFFSICKSQIYLIIRYSWLKNRLKKEAGKEKLKAKQTRSKQSTEKKKKTHFLSFSYENK